MSDSIDTNSLAQQVKDVALNAVNTVKEAVVGEAAPADDKHRVFVGNLSTETTEDDLKSLFSGVGEITSVSLPARRNHRSKTQSPSGIAFLSFTSDADAQKAVDSVNGKTLGEREITVAIARPLTHQRRGTQNKATAVDGAETADGSTPGTSDQKSRRPKKSKAAPAASTETTNESATVPQTNGASSTRTRSPQRPRRERGPPSDGVPSEKTLFVAGIAAKTTNAGLKELFLAYKPVSAHVSLRPIPKYMVKRLAEKGEQRLNRGFGFVSFADHDAQQAALKAMDGHKVGDRELAVKVALDSPERANETAPATEA